MAGPHLSAADLTNHDPRARPWSPGMRVRYCCPLPECQGKKVDAAHRTLTVYPEGGWTCARCKSKGKLTDAWTDRPFIPTPRLRTARDVARAAFSLTSAARQHLTTPERLDCLDEIPRIPPDERRYDYAAEVAQVIPIAGTASAAYLASRGVSEALAARCGVRHSSAFGSTAWWERGGARYVNGKGGPAVVFPLRRGGRVVGMCGRCVDGAFWKGVSKLTLKGDPGGEAGVFLTPGALEAAVTVVVEAPIDALSLAACGVPALATVGTSCPGWLLDVLALRRVALAHDADEAGDRAADAIAAELRTRGAHCERLRPEGGKDWNEALLFLGLNPLGAKIRTALKIPEPDPFEDPGETSAEDDRTAAFVGPDHQEHAKGPEPGGNGRSGAARGISRKWPPVGSQEYARACLADKWEACAAAGLPSSSLMGELLRRNNCTTGEACALQSLIESEARE